MTVFEYIENLEFTPGSPDWRAMSEAERHLAAFAALMADHVGDGLYNVVWSGSGDEAIYAAALRAIGAAWLADEVRAVAAIEDIESQAAEDQLERTWNNVEARHTELWDLAAAYAKANVPPSRWGE